MLLKILIFIFFFNFFQSLSFRVFPLKSIGTRICLTIHDPNTIVYTLQNGLGFALYTVQTGDWFPLLLGKKKTIVINVE